MAKQIASNNSKPGAWIVSPTDKGRKSIKNGVCFLENNEIFEIELFNPLTVSVLTDIKLNGQSISKTGLVLKPGQRVYLDCFIDDKKKFKFSTYEIENSNEAFEATKNNGILEVFFYKEDVITLDWKRKFDKYYYPIYYPIYYPNNWGVYNGSGTITANTLGIGSTTTLNCYYSNSVDCTNLGIDNSGPLSSNTIPINSIETGRVEKGEDSKQKFTDVYMDFEKNYISSTIIQILPESRKPVEVKNVKINIELPKGDWTKKQIEEAKEAVQDLLWKEKTNENQKEMNNSIELIKKLADLHSAGILTDEEFSEKKTELLSKI